jgi:hypothetical protein
MRRRRESQLSMGWGGLTRDLPADVAEECRKLVAQLLRRVVETERDEEGGGGEREDHLTSS